MPSATTHVEFAKDVLRFMDENEKQKITNLPMYYLGSQGPDLFFFSKASVPPKSLRKYGSLMHRKKVFEAVTFLHDHCENDPDLYSYYCGYLCHYALDSTCHPLVYALAKTEAELTDGNEGVIHVRMEAEMDVWLLHQRGRKMTDYNVWKWMKIDRQSGQKLADVYHQLLNDVYHSDVPVKEIIGAEKDVVRCTRLLKPGKHKYKGVFEAESIVHAPHGVSAMMLNEKETAYCLNLERHTFEDSSKPEGISNLSFPEIYGKAIPLAISLMEKIPQEEDYWINFLGEPKDHLTR